MKESDAGEVQQGCSAVQLSSVLCLFWADGASQRARVAATNSRSKGAAPESDFGETSKKGSTLLLYVCVLCCVFVCLGFVSAFWLGCCPHKMISSHLARSAYSFCGVSTMRSSAELAQASCTITLCEKHVTQQNDR